MFKKIINYYKRHFKIYLPLYYVSRSKEFKKTYKFLKKIENWDYEETKEWQLKQISNIVDYAFENVPFYTKLYSRIGYKLGDIKTFQDINKLPMISKDDVKNNYEDFISKDIKNIPHQVSYTGGSTDKPMKFLVDKKINSREEAYYYYYWEKMGYKIGDKRIIFRGHKVADLKKKKFYVRDNLRNTLYFDSDYLTSTQYFKYYDNQIKKFKPKVISGYPSSIYTLANNYRNLNLPPPQVKMVILASENVYEDQIALIKKTFNPEKVIYQYGHSEQVLIAFKYKDRKELGFPPTYGYLEMIEEKSNDIYELVGTSFSKSMPFIRYKTNDFASASNYKSDDFMKNYKSVSKIEGRLQEFIYTKDKRLISLVSIAGAHLPEYTFIKDMQYEQFEPGKLQLNVVFSDDYSESNKLYNDLIESLEKLFDHSLDVSIKKVKKINRTVSNKKIMLIQHIK